MWWDRILPWRDSTILLKEEVVITAQRMEANSSAVAEAWLRRHGTEIVRLPSLNTPDVMAFHGRCVDAED